MFFLVMLFSVFMGMVFLPVVLSVVGPRSLATIEEIDAAAKNKVASKQPSSDVEMASV